MKAIRALALAWMVAAVGGCGGAGEDPGTKSGPIDAICAPKSCAELGAQCGQPSDGCGGTLSCGECPFGQSCDAQNQCAPGPCIPLTCAELGAQCGSVSEGCAGILFCGTCATGFVCGDANQCTRLPPDPVVGLNVISSVGDCAGLVPVIPPSHVQHTVAAGANESCEDGTSDGAGFVALRRHGTDGVDTWDFVAPTGGTRLNTASGAYMEALIPQARGFHAAAGIRDLQSGVSEHRVYSSGGALIWRTPLFAAAARDTNYPAEVGIGGIAGEGSVVAFGYKPPSAPDFSTPKVVKLSRFGTTGAHEWSTEVDHGLGEWPFAAAPVVSLSGAIFGVLATPWGANSAAWFSANGAQLTEYLLIVDPSYRYWSGVDPSNRYWSGVRSGRFPGSPLYDGRIVLQGLDPDVVDSAQRWFASFSPAAIQHRWSLGLGTVPQWLSESPNTRVFLLPGRRGYAVADAPASDQRPTPCAHHLDIRAKTGQLCATLTFKVSDYACTSAGGLSVGLDGTVIQQVHAEDAGVVCPGGTCPCVRRWWTGLLK